MRIAKGPAWIGGSFIAISMAVAGALITYSEGAKYTAYADPAGHGWAICYGHTKGVKQGDKATADQCKAYLQQDLPLAYADVDRCITATLTVGQAAAFTDAVYNIGPRVVCGSTLQKLANSGDVAGACRQLERWNRPVNLPGIAKRRQSEQDLCLNGLK